MTMKERPILFSGPMVREIIAGRKTQTRRTMKPQPAWREVDDPTGITASGIWWETRKGTGVHSQPNDVAFKECINRSGHAGIFCPYGRVGERLWVRETWGGGHSSRAFVYRATEPTAVMCWKPSIHMPRVASRITLEITGVRVERLQEIGGDDCAAEGIKPDWDLFYEATEGADGWDEPEEFVEECEEECDWVNYGHRLVESSEHKEWELDRLNFALRLAFRELWQSINGPDSWSANPWVWVIEFKRVQP